MNTQASFTSSINANSIQSCVQVMNFGGMMQKGVNILPLNILPICQNNCLYEHDFC